LLLKFSHPLLVGGDTTVITRFWINPAKVQDFYRIKDSLRANPAKVQEFFTISAKKETSVHKSCINAGFFNNRNKIGKYDVLLHHF